MGESAERIRTQIREGPGPEAAEAGAHSAADYQARQEARDDQPQATRTRATADGRASGPAGEGDAGAVPTGATGGSAGESQSCD